MKRPFSLFYALTIYSLMSIYSLSAAEANEAHSLGWGLYQVYCLDKQQILLTVLPANNVYRNADEAMKAVVWLAKSRNETALKALTLISKHNIAKGKK